MNLGYQYKFAFLRIILIALCNRLADFFEGNLTNRFLSLVLGQSILVFYIIFLIKHTFQYSLKFKIKKKAVFLIFILIFAQGIKFLARAYRYNSGKPLYESGPLQTILYVILPFYKIYISNLPTSLTSNLKMSCLYHSIVSIVYVAYEISSNRYNATQYLFEFIDIALQYLEYEFTYELCFSEVFFLSQYLFNLLFSGFGVYYNSSYAWNYSDNYFVAAYILFQIIVVSLSNFDLGGKFAKYKEVNLVVVDSHFQNFLNPIFRAVDIYYQIYMTCLIRNKSSVGLSQIDLTKVMTSINKLAVYIIIVMLYAFNFVIQSITSYTVSY